MDEQIKIINKAMQSLEKTARSEIKKDEDKDKDDKPEYGYASTIRLSGV